MERSLLFGALALGCVGYACGVALTQSSNRRDGRGDSLPVPRAFVVLAALLPALVFLGSLPSRPPFASGHGLGSGFAIGGVGALLAGWLLIRAGVREPGRRDVPLFGAAVSAGPLSAGVAAVAATQLLLHAELIDALAGVAIGWFAVTITLIAGLSASRGSDDGTASILLPLASSAGFVVVASSAATLGAYRGSAVFASGTWSATGTALAAGVPLTVYLASLTAPVFARIGLKTPFPRLFAWLTQRLVSTEDGRAAAARVWRALAATAVLLLLAKLLSSRALNEPDIFYCVVAGSLAGCVCWWLSAEGQAESEDGEALSPQLVPIAVLLVLGTAVVAFNRLAGFGIAAALIGAWLSLAMAQAFVEESHPSQERAANAGKTAAGLLGLLHLLLFGIGFLLYRLVTTRFADDLRGVGLADHYGIAGFITGAVTPVLLSSLLAPRHGATEGRAARAITRLVIAGILTLAIPGLALILWRSKVALALVAGLSLATVSPLWRASDGRNPRGVESSALLQALFALGTMAALSQWTHHALQFASLTRDAKIGLVTWIVGGVIAAILILDFGGRIAAARARRDSLTAAPVGPGGGADR